jgi:hypothetical protein
LTSGLQNKYVQGSQWAKMEEQHQEDFKKSLMD